MVDSVDYRRSLVGAAAGFQTSRRRHGRNLGRMLRWYWTMLLVDAAAGSGDVLQCDGTCARWHCRRAVHCKKYHPRLDPRRLRRLERNLRR